MINQSADDVLSFLKRVVRRRFRSLYLAENLHVMPRIGIEQSDVHSMTENLTCETANVCEGGLSLLLGKTEKELGAHASSVLLKRSLLEMRLQVLIPNLLVPSNSARLLVLFDERKIYLLPKRHDRLIRIYRSVRCVHPLHDHSGKLLYSLARR